MTSSNKNLSFLRNREAFLKKVVEKLGTHRCNFLEKFQGIPSERAMWKRRVAAGVLLPVIFREHGFDNSGEFVFQLIKRSSVVKQAGDLSLPGGMLNPVLDRILRPLLIHGPFPILAEAARSYALQQQATSFRLITLFLTNALRETYEEIRLLPTQLRYLGPLPAYNLTLLQRIIFPLVGFINDPPRLQPNIEVEKIVEIPLLSFFRQEAYGNCQVVMPGSLEAKFQYPCLIHSDSDSSVEVLWGATFNIIGTFLNIVASWRLPAWRQGPVIKRTVNSQYLGGGV